MTEQWIIPKPVLPPPPAPEMHTHPCVHCPSVQGHDPESADIATWSHADRVETAFPCGWRPNKYCKGYCDQMGISNADLEKLHEAGKYANR